MHILTFILWFICASIFVYNRSGDTSGLEVIGKILAVVGVIFLIVAMMSSAAVFAIVMIIIMGLIAWCSKNNQW